MDDLDDVLEVADELEEFVELDDVVEDVFDNALAGAAAVAAVIAGLLTLLLVVATVALLVLSVGVFRAVAVLAIVTSLITLAAVGAFLYFRTTIPDHVQSRIDEALARADDTPPGDGTMSEQEAIEAVKEQYADGDLTNRELERRLEAIMESDDPGAVVRRDGERAPARERAVETD